MPVYERKCQNLDCDWKSDFCLEKYEDKIKPCPTCGHFTERVWTSGPAVIPDTFSTPLVDTNMERTPRTFHSRSEHARALKAANLRIKDSHVGTQGSDKSPHTTRWV